jgi:hypothetical protein
MNYQGQDGQDKKNPTDPCYPKAGLLRLNDGEGDLSWQ